MHILRGGGQWLFVLLLALWGVRSAHAQSPADASFLSILGELREASFPDKEAIIDRLSQTNHPSVRVVLTAFMEDRLFYRTAEKPEDQKIVIVKSTEGDPAVLDLIDPLTLKAAGTAPMDSLTSINTNNHLRQVLRTTVAHFALSSPDAAVRIEAVHDMMRSRGRSDSETPSRARRHRNKRCSQKRNLHRSGARGAGRLRTPQMRLDAIGTFEEQQQSGCSEQACRPSRSILRWQILRTRRRRCERRHQTPC